MRRRLTLAERKHRARLSRERQGPDGKWETNAKKRAAWVVKHASAKKGSVAEVLKAKSLADEAAALAVVGSLVVALDEVQETSKMREVMPRLQALLVTPKVLQQQPSLEEALVKAAKRCRKSKDEEVVQLLSSWREALRDPRHAATSTEEAQRLLDEKPAAASALKLLEYLSLQTVDAQTLVRTKISVTVNMVRKTYKDNNAVASVASELRARWTRVFLEAQAAGTLMRKRCASKCAPEDAVQTTSVEPKRQAPQRMVARPLANRRKNVKLAGLFAALRTKRVAEDIAMLEVVPSLVAELRDAADWVTLRKILPRLERVAMTTAVAKQCPELLQSLEMVAKRCRKSKDNVVAGLLRSWRKVHGSLEESVMYEPSLPADEEAEKKRDRDELSPSKLIASQQDECVLIVNDGDSQSRPNKPPKQSKLTAFLRSPALAKAGG